MTENSMEYRDSEGDEENTVSSKSKEKAKNMNKKGNSRIKLELGGGDDTTAGGSGGNNNNSSYDPKNGMMSSIMELEEESKGYCDSSIDNS